MARILFVQPSMQPPGGGNGVAAWMLQAIVAEHDVTLLTWRTVDFDAINRFYGTSLRREDVSRRQVARPWRIALDRVPLPMALMKSAIIASAASTLNEPFDIAMSANNEADYGRPNIQYIHYPTFIRPRPLVDIRWYHHPTVVLDVYYWLADRMLRFSRERMLAGRTLVNSDWTGRAFVRRHGGATETLYPPIATSFPDVPWAERQNAFVAIGRISPEKKYERILQIVAGVRRTHPGMRLHVIGSREPGWYCGRMIRQLRQHDWVTVHLDVPRHELVRLITSNRYGIHGMDEEHFGIGPAELVAGGCLTWVPNSGGQVEILRADPRFTYDDVDDAVTKILGMMSDDDSQRVVRAALRERTREFSVDHFQERVRGVVRELLAATRRPS